MTHPTFVDAVDAHEYLVQINGLPSKEAAILVERAAEALMLLYLLELVDEQGEPTSFGHSMALVPEGTAWKMLVGDEGPRLRAALHQLIRGKA